MFTASNSGASQSLAAFYFFAARDGLTIDGGHTQWTPRLHNLFADTA